MKEITEKELLSKSHADKCKCIVVILNQKLKFAKDKGGTICKKY